MKTVLIVLFCIVNLAQAEPSATVNRLMNEPASMFDIGMLRLRDLNKTTWVPMLEGQIQNLAIDKKIISKKSEGVIYSFDENRITIEVMFYGNPNEKDCSTILHKYKDSISSIRKKSPKFAATVFSGNFDHINYSSGGSSKHWHLEIVNITRVMVGIEEVLVPTKDSERDEYTALRDMAGGKSIFCSGPIFTDEVVYRKYGF